MTIEIPVAGGGVVLVDDDYGYLADYSWHSHTGFAARGGQRRGVTLFMHTIILEHMMGRRLVRGEVCDHINSNKLDNRCCNLRVASLSQDRWNMGKRKQNTSGFKGVSWVARRRQWDARIMADHKTIFLGYFDTPEEAHIAYCNAADELHGEFANYG